MLGPWRLWHQAAASSLPGLGKTAKSQSQKAPPKKKPKASTQGTVLGTCQAGGQALLWRALVGRVCQSERSGKAAGKNKDREANRGLPSADELTAHTTRTALGPRLLL